MKNCLHCMTPTPSVALPALLSRPPLTHQHDTPGCLPGGGGVRDSHQLSQRYLQSARRREGGVCCVCQGDGLPSGGPQCEDGGVAGGPEGSGS